MLGLNPLGFSPVGMSVVLSGGAVTPPPATVVSVSVSPSSVTLAGSATQVFTATVAGNNSPSQSVTWAASAGSIDAGGNFTAPAATSSAQTITITAKSVADTSKSGTAIVTVSAAQPAGYVDVPASRTVNFDGGTNRVDFGGGTNRVNF